MLPKSTFFCYFIKGIDVKQSLSIIIKNNSISGYQLGPPMVHDCTCTTPSYPLSMSPQLGFAYVKKTSTIHVLTFFHTNLPKLFALLPLSFCSWKETTSTLWGIIGMYYHTLKAFFSRLSPWTLYDERCNFMVNDFDVRSCQWSSYGVYPLVHEISPRIK